MEVLYITNEEYKIQKSMDTLIVRHGNKKVESIPLVHLKSIVVFGNVQITSQVLYLLMSNGTDVIFFDRKGNVPGIIMSNQSNNILLRISQFRLWNNDDFRLEFSKKIAKAKIRNQITVLNRISREKKLNLEVVNESLCFINEQLSQIDSASSIQAIMGYEGICAKSYFTCYGKFIKDFKFNNREKRPAKEPVNALLNYTYAFLRNEMILRLSAYGFDISLGFMHGVRYGRDSLALDMMEAFRPVFADYFVFHLFDSGIITNDAFEFIENACVLTDEGIGVFCRHYEFNLTTVSNQGVWFKIFDREIKRFRENVLSSKLFSPYYFKGEK